MSPQRREIGSGYIEWAKLRSKARYHLATSDVCALPVADLHPQLADLEISGSDGYGYAPLLEKLSAKSGVPTENIVHAQGTSMANHLAMAALLEPGDEVLIEEPSYGPIVSTAEYLGATIRRFPRKFESGFQLDPREIERNISPRTRLVVLANLHNPSGVRTADTKLRTAGEIARSMRAHVLVDEVYLETCFDSPVAVRFSAGAKFCGYQQFDQSLRPIGTALRMDFRGKAAGRTYVAPQRPVWCYGLASSGIAQRSGPGTSAGDCRARKKAAG